MTGVMNNTQIAAAVLIPAFAAAAGAEVNLIDLLPGYTLGHTSGLSADGSTLAVNMFVTQAIQYDAFAWRDGGWSSLPRMDQFNLWHGLSADGNTTLSVSSEWGGRPRLVRVENGVRDWITFGTDDRQLEAAMTRDGQTVFYTMGGQASGPIDVFMYSANTYPATQIMTLGDQYSRVNDVFAGSRQDRFVMNTSLLPSGIGMSSTARALLYDSNAVFEIPTLSGDTDVQSRAVGMTADGSTIIGVEQDSSNLSDPDRSWMYRNGVLTEMTLDGFEHFSIGSITDDASAWVGGAFNSDGTGESFLVYEDGRTLSVHDLLATEGVLVGENEFASLQHISANGAVVSGVINRGFSGAFGPEVTLFTINVPAPSSAAFALLGLGLIPRRRR